MSPIFLAVLTAFLGLVAGYLINQLPGFKNFPGKNAFIFRVLGEVAALIIILAVFGTLSGQNEPKKNAEQLAWLEKGLLITGAIFVFDSLQMGWAVWNHQRSSGLETGIDDENKRLELLTLVSDEIRQRQRENFKQLQPQVVIPLGLQDVREEVGQSRFIPTEDPQQPEAGQPKLWLELKRIFRLGDRPTTEIPTTQRLIDVFDRADRRLLILGKPGAGKTTLLLELAAQLLAKAHQPDCHQIPVRLECSDWKDDKQSLTDWLIFQLQDKYRVPVGLSRRWIEKKQLVPLLDGLDELGLERQQQATMAIAKFISDYNYPALVVCCRQEEWRQAQETQETQFGLNGAVYLEPLTDEQIQSYLQQVKRPGLWAHIQSSDLQALLPDWDTCKKDGEVPGLRSPLLLNMLLVAYKDGKPIRSQSELFQAYIQAQFSRSGKSKYTEAQTRRYLTWLARQLKAERVTEFEIENLQPSWLEKNWQLWVYRIISGLIFGLIFGLITGIFTGIFTVVLFGIFGFFDRIETTDSFDLSTAVIKRGLIEGIFGGLLTGIIAVPFFGLFFGLFAGLIFGLISGLTSGLEHTKIRSKVYPNESIFNTAKNSAFTGITGFFAGTLLFTLLRLTADQSLEWDRCILAGLTGGITVGMSTLLSVAKHGLLRLLLWTNKSSPWNYADFLDYANKLRLVQSMGGRYRFVHDLLREEIIGSTSPARRLAITPEWIQYPVMLLSILITISVTGRTQMVSSKLAQITMPILHTGDLVFFDDYSYRLTDPQRDDLVSFQAEGSENISREWIVGLPGENISSKDSQLLVNGKPIDRPYTHFPPNFTISKKPFKVPAQSYFVVGKKISKDGKTVPTMEVVNRKQLNGRWLWRLWPLHRFGSIK